MPAQISNVALVTGCSEPESLGAALALNLLGRGYKVYATARKLESMKQLEGKGCEVLALDVLDASSVVAAAEVVKEADGRLDVLVNNAGAFFPSSVLDTDPERFLALMDVNAAGLIRVVQGFADLLIKTANSKSLGAGKAVVINVASVARHGTAWQVSYDSSKAAAHIVSETMRRELAPLGVQVATVELAAVRTAMTNGQRRVEIPSSRYYPNIKEINDKWLADQDKRMQSATSPADAASEILGAALARKRPTVIFAGYQAGMFKWVWHLLPLGLVDGLMRKLKYVNMVERPSVE
ncbi:hypothetical protein EHS25_001346 [Saitozyma podzolica]|uniref:NADPH-dependent 1-acyldihydroxyacetone phosphate reductase n=1 Tax=Saitozyma podzolica TaxID=1890683 RepID=A0A427YG40_9TREE|nr:hypothetical protein EHS25_001346 [Saitozyma podzolica]